MNFQVGLIPVVLWLFWVLFHVVLVLVQGKTVTIYPHLRLLCVVRIGCSHSTYVKGAAYCERTTHIFHRHPLENKETPSRPFDSIFGQKGAANGGHQKHNEYVTFDKNHVYPEYIVRYTVWRIQMHSNFTSHSPLSVSINKNQHSQLESLSFRLHYPSRSG
jgi:hypothetical protein